MLNYWVLPAVKCEGLFGVLSAAAYWPHGSPLPSTHTETQGAQTWHFHIQRHCCQSVSLNPPHIKMTPKSLHRVGYRPSVKNNFSAVARTTCGPKSKTNTHPQKNQKKPGNVASQHVVQITLHSWQWWKHSRCETEPCMPQRPAPTGDIHLYVCEGAEALLTNSLFVSEAPVPQQHSSTLTLNAGQSMNVYRRLTVSIPTALSWKHRFLTSSCSPESELRNAIKRYIVWGGTSGGVYVPCIYANARWVTVGDSGLCCTFVTSSKR